jgi:hypothetical protein
MYASSAHDMSSATRGPSPEQKLLPASSCGGDSPILSMLRLIAGVNVARNGRLEEASMLFILGASFWSGSLDNLLEQSAMS